MSLPDGRTGGSYNYYVNTKPVRASVSQIKFRFPRLSHVQHIGKIIQNSPEKVCSLTPKIIVASIDLTLILPSDVRSMPLA